MLANRMLMVKRSGEYGMDSFTKALLHFNGANGSTTFTDESGKIWTAFGNAKISTVQFVFGGASGYFDGTGDYISTPYVSDFNTYNGKVFTIDFRFKRDGLLRNDTLFQVGGTSSSQAIEITFIQSNNLLYYQYWTGSGSFAQGTGITVADTAWHHFAMVSNGTTIKFYLDGISSASTTTTFLDQTNGILGIGAGWSGNFFKGYIDEFRFSTGIARWTSNFTPPS